MRKGMLIFTVGAIAVMAAGCAKDDAGKNMEKRQRLYQLAHWRRKKLYRQKIVLL